MKVEPRTLKYVAEAAGGGIVRGDPCLLIGPIETDSRALTPGSLFVALEGERFDGHDFLLEARQRGAAATLVHRKEKIPPDVACVVVDNTRRALGQLGRVYRNDFDLPIVAVGGANGKTSTKELIASVLRQKGPTLKSEASFNNDLGVPLTLLRLEASHQAAVLEVGTNHPGELAPLLLMIRPKFGIVTSIGREHLEFFGDLAGVAREEGAVAEALPAGGLLLINGDSPEIGQIIRRTKARILKVGFENGNDWRVGSVRMERHGTVFAVQGKDPQYAGEYSVRLLGRHQAVNALFAILIGREFGLSKKAIQTALLECEGAKMRLQAKEANGWIVLDDSYNANPDSMAAAIVALKEYPNRGRKAAALGDMGELGSWSRAEHHGAGRAAGEAGLDALFTAGKFSAHTAAGAREAGLKDVREFASIEDLVADLRNFLQNEDAVLVKASRSSTFEKVVQGLLKDKT